MKSEYLEGLSLVQRQAVEENEGPSLIIAGAGSGKTRVLTCRIAALLQKGVPPWQILALTFTNKAAREMKERISGMVDEESAHRLWMGTFHSLFARILRSESELLGWPSNFTIYDKSDSKNAIKACIKELELDDEKYAAGLVQARISMAKNNLINAAAYAGTGYIMEADRASKRPEIAEVYRLYAQKCRLSGAMDFDDLLLYTNVLFQDHPQTLEKYGSRFTHILVDEYQDTNYAQYLIVKKLAQKHRNLCVVGDDAQSIYAFRGARIENILNFRNDFPEAKEYKLIQNYRSTQTIVNAANSVIKNNARQFEKECYSNAAMGEKIEVLKAYTDQDEAYMVAASILARQYASHAVYSDFAILYRTNAQSRTFEEAFRKRNIPYKIFGGISFYERAEIKDILAYLRLVVNPRDDEAFKRVVNVPARGIGGTTLMRLQSAASKRQTSLWEQIEEGNLTEHGVKPATEKRLLAFKEVISELALQQFTSQAYDFAMEVVRKSGYMAELEGDRSIEGKTRMENVGEFFNSIKKIAETENVEEEMTIHPFLANVALITDLEEQDDPLGERVKLMTVHAAKGLEFNYVYVVGLEEELFPSSKVTERPQELEEERRLFYVALTRAKKGVSLSFAKMRYKWGKQSKSRPSRFLKEIDSKWLSKRVEEEPESDAPDWRFERRRGFSDSHFEKRTFPSVSRVSQSNKPVFSQRPTSIASPANASASGFVPDDPALFKAGQSVEHASFGRGAILSIEGRSVSERKAVVRFDGSGTKTLLLKFARMRVVSGE